MHILLLSLALLTHAHSMFCSLNYPQRSQPSQRPRIIFAALRPATIARITSEHIQSETHIKLVQVIAKPNAKQQPTAPKNVPVKITFPEKTFDRASEKKALQTLFSIEDSEASMLCDALEVIHLNKKASTDTEQTFLYNAAQPLIKQLDELGNEAQTAGHMRLAKFCTVKSGALQLVRQAPLREPIESASMECN